MHVTTVFTHLIHGCHTHAEVQGWACVFDVITSIATLLYAMGVILDLCTEHFSERCIRT